MSEHFVNRYVVLLGRCGLGGTAYEIHARPEDLEELGKNLMARVAQYREGSAPIQRHMQQFGIPVAEAEPVLLLSEYVTLSQERTDRMCISFHAAKSLDEHHVLKPPEKSAASLGAKLAKVLWFVVLPLVGSVFCLYAAFNGLSHLFTYGGLP
jgi:hypothetical protein